MRARRLASGVVLALMLCAAGDRPGAAAPTPVLVELFTSEGCSSCPPADQLLARLADAGVVDGAAILPLGEHVDYWDELGWRDRFSSAAYTARQQIYAHRFGGDGPYTPQLVIDGRAECIGSDAAAARRAIARAASAAHGTVRLTVVGDRARVEIDGLAQKATDRADVVLAVTEDRLRSDVTRGENHGRTLTHAAVVRRMEKIGEAIGGAATVDHVLTLAPDWQRDRLHVVVFVQQRHAGEVLAAASAPLVTRP